MPDFVVTTKQRVYAKSPEDAAKQVARFGFRVTAVEPCEGNCGLSRGAPADRTWSPVIDQRAPETSIAERLFR